MAEEVRGPEQLELVLGAALTLSGKGLQATPTCQTGRAGAGAGGIAEGVVSAVRAGATSVRVAELLGVTLKREGDHFKGRCPLPDHRKEQSGKTPPFTVYSSERGGWKCFSCGDGGADGIALYQAVRGTDFPETIRALGLSLGISIEQLSRKGNGARPCATKPRPAVAPAATKRKEPAAPLPWEASEEPPAALWHEQNGTPSEAWKIRDAAGRLFAVHCRFELDDGGKAFAWWRNGKWTLSGVKVAAAPLYGAELLGGWDQGAAVIVTEGEKAADALQARGLQAVATVCGSGTTPGAGALVVLGGWRGPVILWPDFDDSGRAHMERVRAALPPGPDVRAFAPSDLPVKGDAVEWLAARAAEAPGAGLLAEILVGAAKCWPAEEQPPAAGVDESSAAGGPADARDISVSLGELCRMIIPTREDVLGGVLKVGDASCISGQPGRGKSLVAVAAAIAIASGRSFVGLAVPRARPVLYWDGELLLSEEKERATKLAAGLGLAQADFDLLPLQFVVEMAQPEEPPKLGTPAGRARLEWLLAQHPEIEVVFLDSLRILFGLGDENKSESWAPVNDFLLAMKRRGLSVVCIHHNSRADTFNGHLSGATAFSQIVNLTARSEGEDLAEVTGLDWSYSKARSLTGAEKIPFGLTLEGEPDGRLYWARCDASSTKRPKRRREDPRRAHFLSLLAGGAGMRAACKAVGCSTSTGWKWRQPGGGTESPYRKAGAEAYRRSLPLKGRSEPTITSPRIGHVSRYRRRYSDTGVRRW